MIVFRLNNIQAGEETECGFFMDYEGAINEMNRLQLLIEKFKAQVAVDSNQFYEDTEEVHGLSRKFEIEEVEVK